MIKDVNGKFDHYSISPKIRQILLDWVYELVGSDLLWLISLTTFVHKNINPYWFNRQELLQKAKDRYHNSGVKRKAAEYYIANKDVLKEKANSKYKNLSQEEKEAKREYRKNKYRNIKEKTSENFNFFYSIKMGGKT